MPDGLADSTIPTPGAARRCILPGVKAKKTVSQRAKLEKELREALSEIDEEGLLFLLRQAQVLIYNARVDRINEAAREVGSAKEKSPSAAAVDIEETEGGTTFFLTLGRIRKVLTREELRRIVRICYAAETKSDALRQLHTVLKQERRDILADAGISSPSSPLLEQLFRAVRAKYQLQDR
jgi:hypothetical protein